MNYENICSGQLLLILIWQYVMWQVCDLFSLSFFIFFVTLLSCCWAYEWRSTADMFAKCNVIIFLYNRGWDWSVRWSEVRFQEQFTDEYRKKAKHDAVFPATQRHLCLFEIDLNSIETQFNGSKCYQLLLRVSVVHRDLRRPKKEEGSWLTEHTLYLI